MSLSLLPWRMAGALPELTPDVLDRYGIRLLMLDFDNTVVPYTTDTPTPEMEAWLRGAVASHIPVCVVSNSKRHRVKRFCRAYGIPCITHAKKPSAKGISQCLAQFGIPAEQAALVGDQIYTDVLGANCAGVRSILVRAINNHNFWLKLRHVAELPFVFAARKRRI